MKVLTLEEIYAIHKRTGRSEMVIMCEQVPCAYCGVNAGEPCIRVDPDYTLDKVDSKPGVLIVHGERMKAATELGCCKQYNESGGFLKVVLS